MRHRNPDLFGIDIERTGAMALGLALTQMVDGFIQPLASRVFSPLGSKWGDIVTTGVSAKVLGSLTGMASRRIGNDMETGGYVLTIGKGIGALLPGFGLSATVPGSISGLLHGGSSAPAAASGTSVVAPAGAGVGYGSKLVSSQNVGL